jgi:leucyl aminopeptidase (aminopeptidase T)
VIVPIPSGFQTDWNRVARLIVHQALRTQPGERVLLHADPTYFPELTEQVRIELTRAGAVEVAAMLLYSPALADVRLRHRRRDDPVLRRQEDEAVRAIFDLADIYIWLPTAWAYNAWQTEQILTTWPGRSIHFHWIMDVRDPVAFRALSEQYVRALFVNYAALAERQRRVVDALRGTSVRLTDDRGTDLRFAIPAHAHFHLGNGDASREFIAAHAKPGSARDREVELPSGAVRTVHVEGPEGQLVVPEQMFAGRYVGALRLEFRGGRLVEIRSDHHSEWLRAAWEQETGDRDLIGEFNVGVNPELRPLPGVTEMSYFGYGDGVLRVSLGDNFESGGSNRSSFHHWLFLTDVSVTAGGRAVVDLGRLVVG